MELSWLSRRQGTFGFPWWPLLQSQIYYIMPMPDTWPHISCRHLNGIKVTKACLCRTSSVQNAKGEFWMHLRYTRSLEGRNKSTYHRRCSNSRNSFSLWWGKGTKDTDLDTQRAEVGETTEGVWCNIKCTRAERIVAGHNCVQICKSLK